ncbi:ABC transporter ATP-binding protein [Bifidobacterium oedipodis]|uniref:ABC transporter ATP-binding protein n=1 Tax=Bifidobacterium oedipodis TaxID=2675322 RepID=A0A7Y0EME6_9BIFI|nr:ABC transporter ATP-binding protein [Bifidobacterium sp. DSM 109957]NMM92916.1 ABC transporter ATP-binding protein [Bifidobacterium sp. DSM 109957]
MNGVSYQEVEGTKVIQLTSEDEIAVAELRNVTATVLLNDGTRLTTVHDANIVFHRGTSTAIVGRSGSGKTSLASIIGLLNMDYTGEVLYGNTDIRERGDAFCSRFRCAHIGFVFQNYSLIPHLRVWENVALPLDYRYRFSRKKIRKQAIRSLGIVGLREKANFAPASLSGGEQQRVAIARALIGNPDILICDEPTGALDEKTGEKIADLLFKQVHDYGTTLVLVTHDLRLAARCQRQLFMDRGEISCST